MGWYEITTIPKGVKLGTQLNEYRNGILQGVHDPKAKCDWLNLVVSVDGNGLWSLDPLENKIHQLAQDRLDRGDCLKWVIDRQSRR